MKTKNSIRYCPSLNLRNTFKRHQQFTKRTVLKMLAVMENQQSGPGPSRSKDDTNATTPENGQSVKEFLATGRTGRRNALPDILVAQQAASSSDLPNRFQNLSTNESKVSDKTNGAPGPSNKSS